MKKSVYLLPNLITAFGLSCGLFAIFKLSLLPAAMVDYQALSFAAGIILLAALADFLDGAVARMTGGESEFGGIFDSLADAISFGVAPALLALKSFSISSSDSYVLIFSALFFSACGVLRLARFSAARLDPPPPTDQAQLAKKNFTGLPIPAAAAVVISTDLSLLSPEFSHFFTLSESAREIWVSLLLLTIGYFMVSRWKFPSFKTLHIRVASFRLIFLTALVAITLFYGLLHHFALTVAFLSWLYVVTAWTLSLLRVISGRRSQILVDYEPEPDELGV